MEKSRTHVAAENGLTMCVTYFKDSNKENFEPAITSVNGDFTKLKPIEPMLAIKENGEIDGPWQNDKKEEDENELQKAIEMSLKEQVSTWVTSY